jgi:hypothetical protein
MSQIDCPRCTGEMFWSAARSRWECECGKSIAVTVVAKRKAADQDPQSENQTDPGSLSVSLQGMVRFNRSHNSARIGRASQWIH